MVAPEARLRFAKRLREFRLPRGYQTARGFARVLGIDENRYTRYERAEVEPDLTLLMKICEALDVTPNDLLGPDMPPMAGFAEAGVGSPPATPEAAATSNRRGTRARSGNGAEPPAASQSAYRASQLVAWQLAEEAVRLKLLSGDAEVALPMQRLAMTGAIYSALVADAMTAISDTSRDLAAASISSEEQARFVLLTSRLIAAINAEL